MNKQNYCVIMGGGVGSRFWPLSREHNPKQFLDLFGTGRSLLRMTFDRFARFIPKENILIVTNEQYKEKVLAHLPDLHPDQILLEPMRRNTAPCIAYAAHHIAAKDPEARVVVAPSDHLILDEEGFAQAVEQALDYVSSHDRLVTLGVRPTRPETGYGYIQMEEQADGNSFVAVKTFTEKPSPEMARVFLSSGEFLWNSGMFVWRNEAILQAFAEHLPELSQVMKRGIGLFATDREGDFIKEHFAQCPKISIDYGVMEKADNVMVLPVDFGWADLGTWGSLYELSEKDDKLNVSAGPRTLFYEATGNIVSSQEPDRLIVVQGISDCIISEADKVILICKRDEEQRIKQFVSEVGVRFGSEYE